MKSRNHALDVVRMSAILPVLFVHYGAFAIKEMPPAVYAMGDLGVEIFFALSGYLIGGIILRDFERGFSWRVAFNFYVRRWMRTLPLYYAFYVVSMFVTIYGLTLDKVWSARCLAYLLFLQNLAWPMIANWYHETWSLAIEEWFYLLFPLLFVALSRLSARTRVLVIALILMIIPLALRIWFYDPMSDVELSVRHIVVLRLDAIAYGILAAWVARTAPAVAPIFANVIGAAGWAGFVFTLATMAGKIDVGAFFLRTFSPSVSAASFGAIVYWAASKRWADRRAGIVLWFSTRSYALYLCHGCVVRTMLYEGWFALPRMQSAFIFTVSVALLAETAHRLIERPAMRRRTRELHVSADAPRLNESGGVQRAGAEQRESYHIDGGRS